MKAAQRLLRDSKGLAAFSLDSVAKAAGVSRLTVYNHFGSRRGLLESIFDDLADRGGLVRIPEAMAMDDPQQALFRLIAIFCGFWAGDAATGQLNEMAALEPEFGQAIAARNERRRKAIGVLVERMCAGRGCQPDRRRDAVDLLFGLTGHAMYRAVAADRPADAACLLIQEACSAVLAAFIPEK
jgi:AcrR family transcriptional regulator